MKESVNLKNRNKLMKCNETKRYKMYKAGKNILYASISMIAMGSWMFLNQQAFADVKPGVSVTAQSQTTNADQTSTKGTDTANNTVQSQPSDSANANQTSLKSSITNAKVTSQTNTTATPTQTVKPAHAQYAYKVDATSVTPQAANAAQGNVSANSNANTGSANTPSTGATTATAPTSLKTIDQLNGEYIDDKGNVSATKPAPAAGGGQTASTADMSKAVTGDLTKVTDSGGTYYTSTDGSFFGQGGKNDSSNHVVVAQKGQTHDNYGKIYYDAKQKQWVLLASNDTSVAGSYSFKNQIDTTSAFDIQGEWYMSKNDPGGGVGIILQPVNPQLAGIGSSSNAAIDIGIQGQKDTTFLGFDGYTSLKTDDHDSNPGELTIRQTDNSGTVGSDGGGFNQLALDTKNSINATSEYPDTPAAKIGENKSDQLDVLFDVNWKPNDSTIDSDGNVAGTLAVAAYAPTDSAMKTPLGKIVTNNVELPSATSIALFGALGGSGSGVTAQGRITSYKLQQVAQKVAVNYVDISNGAAVKPETQINADVGNTLEVAETTSGKSASYGAPIINGYAFVGAVGTDTTGNYQQGVMDVVNPNMLADSSKGTYNTIDVYYRKTGTSTATRTVASYKLPNGTIVPAVTQASGGGSVTAILPGSGTPGTPIKDASGKPIVLSTSLSAVPIQQVAGYISGYTKNDGSWTAGTQIPAGTTDDTSTYKVEYMSTSPKLESVKFYV